MRLNIFRRLKPRFWIVVALLAVLVGFAVWRMLPDAEFSMQLDRQAAYTPLSEPVGEQLAPTGGFAEIAENDGYRLLADLEKQLFRVVDKRAGVVWDSSPADMYDDENLNDNTRKMAASPIHLTYTRNFKEISTTQLLREQFSWQAYPLDQGLQLHYRLDNLELSFVIELLLTSDGLEVRIPDAGIRETEAAGLVSLTIFPLLGAAKQGDQGYIVVPDGAGALVEFDKPHAMSDNTGYSKWVYGADPTFQTSRAPEMVEQLTMPVFGMVKEEGAYVQILQAGATDARLVINPPGVNNLPYYRGGLEFVMRKMYTSRLGSVDRQVPWVERSLIRDDRIAHYYFVGRSDASYAGLAAVVRNYYGQLWERTSGSPDNPLLVRLFMGATRAEGTLMTGAPEVVTTFGEAEQIMDALRAVGIDQFTVALAGWYKDGYYGALPRKLPADSHFGGNDGLRGLVEHARGMNVALSVEDNYLDIIGGRGVTLRSDAVRQPNGQLYTHHPVWANGTYYSTIRWHWLSPSIVKFRENGLDYLQKLGVQSVHLRHVGELLFSDYNKRMPVRRAGMKDIFTQWMSEAASSLGSVSVYTGNDYAAAHADAILDSAMSTSNHYLFDRQVPFVQMVYHGSKVYYTSPINRSDAPDRELLRAIEYGAVPAFELTYRSGGRLKYTSYDRLYSSQYEEWLPELQAAYDMWQHVWQPLKDSFIVDHNEQAPNVFVTEYDDGTKVWVNYSEQTFRSADATVTIEPLSYVVDTKGGRGE